MRMRKFLVFPNPYAHTDANGRLAGATPVGEGLRKTHVMPQRSFVGATRELLDHDSKDRGPALVQQSRSEYRFVWGAEPVEVDASGPLAAYYQQLANAGDLFILGEDKKIPLERLAAARVAAVAQYRAEQSHEAPAKDVDGAPIAGTGCPKLVDEKASCSCITDPDASEWVEQFPLDHDVEAAAEILAAQAAKKAETAKAAADKAKADAKAEAEKKAAEAKAAAEKNKAEAQKRARLALGITDVPPTPPGPGAASTDDGPTGSPPAPPADGAATTETKTTSSRTRAAGAKES